jgi:uracil-DNA glycosylase
MLRPALDLVVSALEQIRENSGRVPCASRRTVDQLVARASLRAVGFDEPEASPRVHGLATGRVRPIGGQDARATSSINKIDLLAAINARVSVCTKCPHLASTRTQTVFGVGSPDADVMFVGEAPGADEDAQGEPFVGRAGQLLTRIIETMGFAREDVYIANILKCRPDVPRGSFGNRPPTPIEMQTCRPYLVEQIQVIQPKVLVALGAVAVEGLLGTRGTMRDLRGRWHSCYGTPLMITYHPAYLLRNQSPSEKRKVWEDMMQVLERLERPISEKQRNYFL